MSDRDSDDHERDDLDDDDDDEEEEEEEPPPAKAAASKASATSSRASSTPGAKSTPLATATMPSSRVLVIGVVALAVGVAVGWFGHIQKAKASLMAEAAPAGSGAPAGPCGVFQSKLCSSTGAQSASCQEAKGAADLLTSSTCEAALGAMPEMLAKVKAGRASCEKLVSRLCADLTPGSKTCGMVKERTPSFPRERCDAMLQNYDKVIAELKQMDEQGGGMQMGGPQRMPPGGMPPGGMPPGGAPPGGAPPGGAPPGAPSHGGIPRITLPQSTPAP